MFGATAIIVKKFEDLYNRKKLGDNSEKVTICLRAQREIIVSLLRDYHTKFAANPPSDPDILQKLSACRRLFVCFKVNVHNYGY